MPAKPAVPSDEPSTTKAVPGGPTGPDAVIGDDPDEGELDPADEGLVVNVHRAVRRQQELETATPAAADPGVDGGAIAGVGSVADIEAELGLLEEPEVPNLGLGDIVKSEARAEFVGVTAEYRNLFFRLADLPAGQTPTAADRAVIARLVRDGWPDVLRGHQEGSSADRPVGIVGGGSVSPGLIVEIVRKIVESRWAAKNLVKVRSHLAKLPTEDEQARKRAAVVEQIQKVTAPLHAQLRVMDDVNSAIKKLKERATQMEAVAKAPHGDNVLGTFFNTPAWITK